MTWLYILLGFILFIALIMLIPIGVKVGFKDELKAVLKIGFIPIQLYPQSLKKRKRKSPKRKSLRRKKRKRKRKRKRSRALSKRRA